jgi:hypothetical protein
MLEALLRPHRTLFLAKTAAPPAGQGSYPTAATVEYWIIFQSVSLDVDELAFAARQTVAPVQAYLRTARMLAVGTVVEVWLDRGVWVIVEGVTTGGKAKWIEFELAEDFGGGADYAIADLIDFHDGIDPDPTPNPDAHAAILTTRTDDDTGVVTFAVYGTLTTSDEAHTGVVTAAGHGLAVGDHADVFWSGGARDHMDVTAVNGDAVTVDGGTGTDLPVATTAVLLTESFVGPVVIYDHGLVVGDYADVFWTIDSVNYSRKRMLVTAVSGNQVTLDEETDVTSGSDLPAADTEVTVLKSFVVWNTLHMYSGLHEPSRSARGTARFSPAKPAYTTAGPPRPDVPEQKEDRYYIDSMECQIPQT